jgi:hypothetical protein
MEKNSTCNFFEVINYPDSANRWKCLFFLNHSPSLQSITFWAISAITQFTLGYRSTFHFPDFSYMQLARLSWRLTCTFFPSLFTSSERSKNSPACEFSECHVDDTTKMRSKFMKLLFLLLGFVLSSINPVADAIPLSNSVLYKDSGVFDNIFYIFNSWLNFVLLLLRSYRPNEYCWL